MPQLLPVATPQLRFQIAMLVTRTVMLTDPVDGPLATTCPLTAAETKAKVTVRLRQYLFCWKLTAAEHRDPTPTPIFALTLVTETQTLAAPELPLIPTFELEGTRPKDVETTETLTAPDVGTLVRTTPLPTTDTPE